MANPYLSALGLRTVRDYARKKRGLGFDDAFMRAVDADFRRVFIFACRSVTPQPDYLDIRVFSASYFLAWFAIFTGRFFAGAVKRPGNQHRQLHFPHSGRAGKKIPVGKFTLSYTTLKERYRLILPDYIPHNYLFIYNIHRHDCRIHKGMSAGMISP